MEERSRFWQPSRLLAFGFLGVILTGTFLLSLPGATATGRRAPLIDAFFTAVSSVCVTGLVVHDTGTYWSLFGQTVVMLLVQVGGLGIMTLSTLFALLRGKRISLPERLAIQTALGHIELAGVVRLTKLILLMTLLMETLGAFLLGLRFLADYPPMQALYLGFFHSISAFNNAGFDLFTTSMIRYNRDPLVLFTIAFLIIAGGLGFTVAVDLGRLLRERFVGGIHHLSMQTRLVLGLTTLLLALGTALILFWEGGNPETLGGMSPGAKVMNAFFMATVPRTAGFNSVPMPSLRETTLFFMILLMFVGASPGGTGGGVKTTTFGVLIMSVMSTIRGRTEVNLFGRRVSGEVVRRSLAIVVISLFLVTTGILVLDFAEQKPLLPVMFEVMSAFGTVGLSVGLTPELTPSGKLILSAIMFAGRLGPLTLALALAQAGPPVRPAVRFPEEKIMVG